jgi:antitoxin HicB
MRSLVARTPCPEPIRCAQGKLREWARFLPSKIPTPRPPPHCDGEGEPTGHARFSLSLACRKAQGILGMTGYVAGRFVWDDGVAAMNLRETYAGRPVRYSMVIEWSDDDQIFVVSLPEWGNLVHTHGTTYEEALQQGKDLIEALIASREASGELLPDPRVFASV